MRSILRIVLVVVVVAIVGVVVVLATANIPAPTQHVERTIPNDKLGR